MSRTDKRDDYNGDERWRRWRRHRSIRWLKENNQSLTTWAINFLLNFSFAQLLQNFFLCEFCIKFIAFTHNSDSVCVCVFLIDSTLWNRKKVSFRKSFRSVRKRWMRCRVLTAIWTAWKWIGIDRRKRNGFGWRRATAAAKTYSSIHFNCSNSSCSGSTTQRTSGKEERKSHSSFRLFRNIWLCHPYFFSRTNCSSNRTCKTFFFGAARSRAFQTKNHAKYFNCSSEIQKQTLFIIAI